MKLCAKYVSMVCKPYEECGSMKAEVILRDSVGMEPPSALIDCSVEGKWFVIPAVQKQAGNSGENALAKHLIKWMQENVKFNCMFIHFLFSV